jgi:hypothetical protein
MCRIVHIGYILVCTEIYVGLYMRPDSDEYYCYHWCGTMRCMCVCDENGRDCNWVLARSLGRIVPGRAGSWDKYQQIVVYPEVSLSEYRSDGVVYAGETMHSASFEDGLVPQNYHLYCATNTSVHPGRSTPAECTACS